VLSTVSLGIACATLYNMVAVSWDALIAAVLPLAILAENLPEQLQALVDLIHVAIPLHNNNDNIFNMTELEMNRYKDGVTMSNGTSMDRSSPQLPVNSLKRTQSDYSSPPSPPKLTRGPSDGSHFTSDGDFLWQGRWPFSKVETFLKYLMLFHIALFLPRPLPIDVNAYNQTNLLPPHSPLWLQYLGLTLYVMLPVVQNLDMRWQLRSWLHQLRSTEVT